MLVGAWVVVSALIPALVVGALGAVVGFIPGAVEHGMGSTAGSRLIGALVVAGLLYAFSLVLDPIGSALGTAANARITGALQGRLLQRSRDRSASGISRIPPFSTDSRGPRDH